MPRPTSEIKSARLRGLLETACALGVRAVFAIMPGICVAAAGEIAFIAPTNHAMPLAQFNHGVLTAGIIKDVGEAIAGRMGLDVRFVSLPSKRVRTALELGQADGVCYVQPEWIDGDYHWSRPFIPNSGVIAARNDMPVVHRLQDLAGTPVGTVLGYRYPDLEKALGQRFVREDAPSMESNIRKLIVGRVAYAVVESMTLAYHMKTQPSTGLRFDIEYDTFTARCAFSPKSRVPFPALNHAIDTLIHDGSMKEIFLRYR